MIKGRMEGKWRQGRPSRHWHDDIVEWLKKDTEIAKRATADQDYYKLFVRVATSDTEYAT